MTFVRPKLFSLLFFAFLLGPSVRGQDIDLVGNVSWQTFGRGIRIQAERIQNNRDRGVSDFLRLQIWATTNVYDGVSDITGYVLGTFNLGSLDASSSFVNASRVIAFAHRGFLRNDYTGGRHQMDLYSGFGELRQFAGRPGPGQLRRFWRAAPF
jgi:hypothetical protein